MKPKGFIDLPWIEGTIWDYKEMIASGWSKFKAHEKYIS